VLEYDPGEALKMSVDPDPDLGRDLEGWSGFKYLHVFAIHIGI